MTNIGDKIQKAINIQGLKPKPKWKFILKDYVIWILFGITILVGSLGFAVTLFLLTDFDWQDYQYLNKGAFEFIIFSLPYIWLVIILLFIGLTYYNFRHTKHGYRQRSYVILFVSIIISLVLGTGLQAAGIGEKIDESLSYSLPTYRKAVPNRKHLWMKPMDGRLVGEITKVNNNRDFDLEDFQGVEWRIYIDEKTIHPPMEIKQDMIIKMMGEKISEHEFRAKRLAPWRQGPRFFPTRPHPELKR